MFYKCSTTSQSYKYRYGKFRYFINCRPLGAYLTSKYSSCGLAARSGQNNVINEKKKSSCSSDNSLLLTNLKCDHVRLVPRYRREDVVRVGAHVC